MSEQQKSEKCDTTTDKHVKPTESGMSNTLISAAALIGAYKIGSFTGKVLGTTLRYVIDKMYDTPTKPKETKEVNTYKDAMRHYWSYLHNTGKSCMGVNRYFHFYNVDEFLRPMFDKYPIPDHLKDYNVDQIFDDSIRLLDYKRGFSGCGRHLRGERNGYAMDIMKIYRSVFYEILYDPTKDYVDDDDENYCYNINSFDEEFMDYEKMVNYVEEWYERR